MRSLIDTRIPTQVLKHHLEMLMCWGGEKEKEAAISQSGVQGVGQHLRM
jgi:hypothetical protein